MRKELTFQCWNCAKTYSKTMELTAQEKVFVSCPYCRLDAVVDLSQFTDTKKVIIRGDDEGQNWWDSLPEFLSTRKLE